MSRDCPSCKATLYRACELCGKYLGEPATPDPFYVSENEGRQDKGTFFCTHSCYRCKDGLKPCVTKRGVCEFPHARND